MKNITINSTRSNEKPLYSIFIQSLLFFVFLFGVQSSFAQKTWDGGAGTNNWGDANNWNANTLPISTDNVTIGNTFTVALNTSITVASLTIGGGTSGSLTIGSGNTDRTLSVTGNVTINSGATLNTTGNGGNIFNIGGNLSNAGTLTDGSGDMDIIFNGGTQTISGAGSFTFTDFLFSTAGTKTINSAITVNGNWTNNGGTIGGTGTVTLAGTGTIAGSSTTAFPNLTVTGTITQGINTSVTGNYNQTAGTYNQNAGATGYSLTVNGNFSLSNATFNIQTTSSGLGATTTVNGATGTTISGTSILNMDSGGAAVANISIFQTTNFTSTATTTSTGIIDFGNRSNTKNNEFRVSGNFSKTGTTGRFYTSATPVNGGFVFNGSGSTQTVSITASSSTEYYNVTVNTGAVVQLAAALTLGTASNPASSMTVNGALEAQTFSILGGNSGTFTLASGSTLKTANVNGVVSGTSGTISTSVSTRTFTTPNYIFNGSANQTANFGNTTINNLTISNTGGSVTLNAAITANDITINSGGGSLTAGSFTHLVAGNWSNNGGTFVPGTGTISLNGTTQAIGGTSSSINFNNLSLSGGTKSFNKLVAVGGNLSIASGALANPGSLGTHTAGTLTLGSIGTAAAKFGSTSTSATPTVYKTDTYFTSGTTGYITVSTGSCTTAISVATIASNNANTSLAKNGDVITVSFTTSETPSATPTATINGSSATVSGSGTSYTATRTVSGDTNGLATFSLSIQNAFGCTATRTTVTNASSVTVDTVAPTIPTGTIASNNANTSLARTGNIITVSFTTSETPAATPTVTISGGTASVSGSGTSYTATRTVLAGDTNGVVPFSISIADAAGNTVSRTTTTNSSSVTVDTSAPTIPTGTIASNNTNTTLAKAGDVITVSFTTSETPASTPTVTISGGGATVSGSGTSYTATRTVLAGDTNGVAPFSISIADAAGNTVSRTTITSGSSVTIDTVAPTIPTATIASNNATTTLAKSGDTITLTFTTSQTPASTPTVTISGGTASVSGSGTSYTATRTVLAGDINGVAPFLISIADATGNTATRTTVTSGSSVTVDTVAPTIQTGTIVSNNANTSLARAGNVITLSFTTSETPASTPTVTISGGAASVSGSGTSYTATRTVLSGDTNGVAPFSISIADATGNSVSRTTTTNASSVTVDTAAPTIPIGTIASNNANTALAKAGDVITVSFTTSETPASTPTVTISGGTAIVSGSGTSYTATRTVLAGDTNGVAPFSISIADASGNTASRTTTTNASSVTIDTVAPTIPTATISSNNATTTLAKSGDTITLTFTTSQTPAATPVVTINGISATVSGSGTSYTATRTVLAGDTNGVAPFLISIADAAGNTATRTTVTSGSSVTVDTVAPTIPTISIASNNANTSLARTGNIITLSFTTSETPSATPVVTINGASATVSGSGTSYTATRTVAGGDTNGVAPFSISIRDAAGNTTLGTATTNSSSVTVDTVAPTIPTATIASNNANTLLAKSGDVITVSFTTSETPESTPTVTISGGVASVSGSGTSYTATRTVLSGDVNGIASFSISISDAAGNTASRTATTNSSSVTVDTSAPTIPTAAIASNNANTSLAKSGDVITLSFTTSETPASTPTVTISGGAASVSGSGTSYTATRTVLSGDTNGIASFSISIADAAGNTASRTATTNSSSVTIDTVAPTFPTISIASNNANTSVAGTGDVITLSFTISETIVTTPVVTIDGSAASVSGSGTSWSATKTVTSCSGNVVTFSINLSDPAGNSASSTSTTDASQVTINPTPSATIVSNGGTICSGFNATFTVNGSNGATLNYTITGQVGTQQLLLTGVNQVITASNASSDVTLTLSSVVNANCTSSTFATGSSTVTVNSLPIVTASNVGGCSGTSITLSGSGTPTGGSGIYSVSNPYTGTSSTTYTYTYTSLNGCSATSAPANITITPQPIWYLDADNDSYYSTSQPSCTSPGAGYTTATLIGGGDCADNDAAINPSATDICYNNIDENCNGLKSDGCAAVVVNMTHSYDNSQLAPLSKAIPAVEYTYHGATNLKYRFSITNVTTGVTAADIIQTSRYINIPGYLHLYNATYTIKVSAVINDEVVPFAGNTITVFSPTIQKINLSSASCGTTLGALTSTISASQGLNATSYTFRIRLNDANPSPTYGYSSSSNRFVSANSFTGFPLTYSTSYRIAVQYTSIDPVTNLPVDSGYGTECVVNTPSIPLTNLVSPTCGSTVSVLNANISAASAPYATSYQFRIRLTSNIGGPYTESAPAVSRFSSLTAFGPLEYNSQYSISVRYSIVSNSVTVWSDYGSECIINTPNMPTTQLAPSQCGLITATSLTQQLNIVSYPGFPNYKVRLQEVIGEDLGVPEDITVPYAYFRLNQFSTVELGKNYNISIAIKQGATFGPFSTECDIHTPPSAKTVQMPFKAMAYPNPFANNFMLDVKTISQSTVNIKVYDMVGRLIEQREVRVSDVENTTIGDNYPSGVYNVVVSQDKIVETLRVVKK